MKNRITLTSLLVMISGVNICAQSLIGTTWSVYDTSDEFYVYFQFDSNKLSYSNNNITYFDVSKFQINKDIMTIIDLPGTPCPADTGTYAFRIQNDTVKFTLQSDLCETRPEVFTTYHWILFETTRIDPLYEISFIEIYPVPATNQVIVVSNDKLQGSNYVVFDQFGLPVFTGILGDEPTPIDISKLITGVYYVQIGDRIGRMIKN